MTTLRLQHKTVIAMHITIIAAIIFACVGAFFLGQHVDRTLTAVDTDATDLHTTLIDVNKPRTGTLAGLNEDIFETKGVLDKTNGILNHEEKQLTTLDAQEAKLFEDIHSLIGTTNLTVNHVNTTLDAITGTSDQLTTDLKTSNDTLQQLPIIVTNTNKLLSDVDAQVNDPAIKKAINATSDTSIQIDGITTSLNKIGQHFEKTIDNPKKSIWDKLKVAWDVAWQAATIIK